MTTTDYVSVDALVFYLYEKRLEYQELLNGSGDNFHEGMLAALDELEKQIDKMKVSL